MKRPAGRILRAGRLRQTIGFATLSILVAFSLPTWAQNTGLLHHQGRVLVGTSVHDGTGLFKFAIVDANATRTFWRNAPDANNDGEPDQAVALPVLRGLYSVHLGDASVPNMAPLPLATFAERIGGLTSDPLYLRIWFNDGTIGFQRLAPDQRISAVSFALAAATVPDASITASKLAPGAVTAASISGTLLPGQIPGLDASKITSGVLPSAQIPNLDASKISSGILPPAQIPGLDAAKITSGVLDPARLPANSNLSARIAELETQLNTLQAQVAQLGGGGATIPPGLVQASTLAADAALIGLGYAPFASFPESAWINGTAAGRPAGRSDHAAVWADGFSRMLIWGGFVAPGVFSAAGAAYEPAGDRWHEMPTVGAPTARAGHSMVWDGVATALVWGGFSAAGHLNTGARLDLRDLTWKPMPTSGAPSARQDHVALRAGTLILIWGGRNNAGRLGDGALYSPSSDAWTSLTLPGSPSARADAGAVWTGNRILIWGGLGVSGPENTGGQLLFQTTPTLAPTGWQRMSLVNAPTARSGHTAIWTGTRLLIWGGRNGESLLGDGASYDPATDTWSPLPVSAAPTPRTGHVAVWTGGEMVIFGGETATGATASGAAFDPVSNRWRPLNSAGGPVPRAHPTAVWSGTEMIVSGGLSGGTPVAEVQRLTPQPPWYLYRKL